jgi:hypothetical protein
VFHSLVFGKIIVALGITNLVTGLFVYFTCRCVPGWQLTKPLMQHGWYQRIFKWHCRIWWVFWTSVVVHAVLAIGYFGWPY